jgi:hypothetical protein
VNNEKNSDLGTNKETILERRKYNHMARKLQNKWLSKEQYMYIEGVIGEEQGTGRMLNKDITTMVVAKYPDLADQIKTVHLSSLITARRAYMKRRAAGTFSWQKKPEETVVNTVDWMSDASAVGEAIQELEPVSAVRPSMKREAFTPPKNMEAPVSHQEYVTTNTIKSPMSSAIKDWKMETMVVTSNIGTISISLNSATLSTGEIAKVLKSILPSKM